MPTSMPQEDAVVDSQTQNQPQGQQGEQGEEGEQGEAGAPGTQVTLGSGEPVDPACESDDIFIDTTTPMFYQCSDGAWVAFSPPPPATEQ